MSSESTTLDLKQDQKTLKSLNVKMKKLRNSQLHSDTDIVQQTFAHITHVLNASDHHQKDLIFEGCTIITLYHEDMIAFVDWTRACNLKYLLNELLKPCGFLLDQVYRTKATLTNPECGIRFVIHGPYSQDEMNAFDEEIKECLKEEKDKQ